MVLFKTFDIFYTSAENDLALFSISLTTIKPLVDLNLIKAINISTYSQLIVFADDSSLWALCVCIGVFKVFFMRVWVCVWSLVVDRSQHAQKPAAIKSSQYALLLCNCLNKAQPRSRFLRLKMRFDLRCTCSSDGPLSIPLVVVTSSLTSLAWTSTLCLDEPVWYRLVLIMCVISAYPVLSVALPNRVPEITHWQINGLSWPSSLLQAALCSWPACSSDARSATEPPTQNTILFASDT